MFYITFLGHNLYFCALEINLYYYEVLFLFGCLVDFVLSCYGYIHSFQVDRLVPSYGAPTCAWFIVLLSLYHTDTYNNNLCICVALLCCAFAHLYSLCSNLSGYKLVSLINVRSALRAGIAGTPAYSPYKSKNKLIFLAREISKFLLNNST